MTASQDVQDSFNDSLNLNSSNHASPCGLKRQVENLDTVLPSSKRICPQSATSSSSKNGEIPKFTGFFTAGSNREIKVSEAALNLARARLCASSECADEGELTTARDEGSKGSSTGFAGFVTAGTNKLITVSDSALELAKRRLNATLEDAPQSTSCVADTENRDPARLPVLSDSRAPSLCVRSTHKAPKQGGFVSPLLRKTPRSTRSTLEPSITPVTRARSKHNPPFRTPSAVVESPTSTGGAAPMPSGPPTTLSGGKRALAAGKVEVQLPKTCRITCVRDLRGCQADTVDFLGIVVESPAHRHTSSNIPVVKVADRYGESVQVELLSSSIPTDISAGSVISIGGAVIKRSQGTLSLILNDSAFVDVEPRDPEAECLHRLFLTGLFDTTPSEDYFTFDGTALRVIGRLSEYSTEASTVMARICSIHYEALVYLGCTTCRRYAVQGPDGVQPCQNCQSKKARYFYSLHAEIADFSGVIEVHFSDEAAEKLIGKPAGGMVKLHKDLLRTKLSPLCYRPMLFRISQQSSRWFIDDWKQLEIPRFKLFLKNIAEQKGYK